MQYAFNPSYKIAVVTGIIVAILLSMNFAPSTSHGQREFVPPNDWWQQPSWSPDGTMLLVNTALDKKSGPTGKRSLLDDQQTLILTAKEYAVKARIKHRVLWSAWSPNAKFLATCTCDAKKFNQFDLEIYDVSGLLLMKTDVAPTAFAWSPDSQKLMITQGNAVSICELTNRSLATLPTDEGEGFWHLPHWSPDGELVAACAELPYKAKSTSRIKIWNAQSHECSKSIDIVGDVHARPLRIDPCVGSIAWSPDGREFLFSQRGAIEIVDTKSGGVRRTIHTNECAQFGYSPKGTYLTFTDRDWLHVLDANTLTEHVALQGPKSGVFKLEWSPDERYMLLLANETIEIFAMPLGNPLGYKSWQDLDSAQWAPDSKSLTLHMINSFVVEMVHLSPPQQAHKSIFENGSCGVPQWNQYPSPRNLEECFVEFDKALSYRHRERFKTTKLNDIGQFGGGSLDDPLISNVFNKWDLFELEKSFRRAGISDSNDIFSIVLESYWCHLNRKPVMLEKLMRSMRKWLQQETLVVEENRPLSKPLLNFTAYDKRIGRFSIGSLKGKLSLITFADTSGVLSTAQLGSLQNLRKLYPSKDLVFVVFLVPNYWPSMLFKADTTGSKSSSEKLTAFQKEPGDIIVSRAPYHLCQNLVEFESIKLEPHSPIVLPQTLVVIDGVVKLRLRFCSDFTERVLKDQIRQALETRTAFSASQ